MNVHIGLMIWKELKNRNISVIEFAEKIGLSKTKFQEILNSPTIEVSLLAQLSEMVGFNFFSYYEKGEVFSGIRSKQLQEYTREIKRLKNLLIEKNVAIEIKDKLIQNLSHTISLLEKGQYL